MGKSTWRIEGNFWNPPDDFESWATRMVYSVFDGKYISVPESWKPTEYELRRYPLETYLRKLEMRAHQDRWIKALRYQEDSVPR